ncbi:MAG: hypothetical protein EOP53_07770 [Sphingobacteriales bacterium]|nr:MAG: hypothetical protein EOP53_07770 [Sphingobacteriales bacterium]
MYDSGMDTYESSLTLNTDSTFEFSTFGCFTDEYTHGKWTLKGKIINLNSDSFFKYDLDVNILEEKYNPKQENYIIEIVDKRNLPIPNVKCAIINYDNTINKGISNEKGICILPAKDIMSYKVEMGFSIDSLFWNYNDDKPINYKKIEVNEALRDFFFTNEKFEFLGNCLKRINSKRNYIYTKAE